ncbi:MAG: HAD hydrolase-like protein, partial [Gammaproteobacteria bacterium]
MSTSGRYKLVVFDWDGTVADSLHGIVSAMQAAISATNLPLRDTEAIKGIIGLGLNESAVALYPEIESRLHDELVRNYR